MLNQDPRLFVNYHYIVGMSEEKVIARALSMNDEPFGLETVNLIARQIKKGYAALFLLYSISRVIADAGSRSYAKFILHTSLWGARATDEVFAFLAVTFHRKIAYYK